MNREIRRYAQSRKVYLWQAAERLGLQDSNFSRKLRHELPAEETRKIIGIIDEIAKENEKGDNKNE